jgi:hypothetical protein
MCEAAIQKLVCQAVVSDQYRSRLLSSDRAEVLRTSGLTEKEQSALMSIPARTIEEFAAGVELLTRQWKRTGKEFPARETAPVCGWIEMELPPRSG